jgi:histidinol-phosphatase (PHP family)
VFCKLIEKDIAIEFNTSRILRKDAPVLPDREVFTRYKELGGKRITLGADAHNTESIASGIKEGLDLLRDIGFTEYTVYIDRKPVQVPIVYIPEEGKE